MLKQFGIWFEGKCVEFFDSIWDKMFSLPSIKETDPHPKADDDAVFQEMIDQVEWESWMDEEKSLDK